MPDRQRRPLSLPGHGSPPQRRTSLRQRLGAALGAGRARIADRGAPLVVATIVLVATAVSVPAAAGITGLQAAGATRLTVVDPVLGPAAASTEAADPTADRSLAVPTGGPATGGPIDPWLFTPLVVDPAPVDVNVASLHPRPAVGRAVTARSATTHPATATKSRGTRGFAPLLWPVRGGYLSQGFGCTGVIWEPAFGSCPHYHNGLDIAAHQGTPIVAAAAGTVVFAGWRSNGGGYQVWVSDGGNMFTGYHHMASVAVYTGERIARGQRIGSVGMTGNATGPHCHFMVSIGPFWAGGRPVDPRRYL